MRRFVPRVPFWLEFILVGCVAVVFLVLGLTVAWAALAPIPSIDNFENRAVSQSTKIFDRTGNIVLYDVHGTMRRTAVPLDEVSENVQHAAVAVEDHTFYTNAGFRPEAFLRAVLVQLHLIPGIQGQGGSTITQQVVKNALLTQKKTLTRKLREIILALRLTRIYSKEKILETYLNETAYGGTIYGVQEASQYFFGVDAKDVGLAQAAYLAALPQAPTYYSPYGNHKSDLDTRKDFVLYQMRKNGFISEEELNMALRDVVVFRDQADAGIKAPHFVFYVREYLEEKYGVDAVQNDGLHVITTLDYDLQKKAEEIVAKHAPSMEANFDASNTGLVAVDPKTGQVLTMVGSRGYFDEKIDGKYNIALAHRQPGSSFKPFIYAAAFAKGYTPETVLFDLQTQFSTHCQPQDVTNNEPPCYSPQNFDDKFRGPMTLRNALAQSINIPALKTLYLVGLPDALTMASNLGITTLGDPGLYGLTLVLGGGEVTLLELTSAYGVFANEGIRNPPTGILRVEDKKGNILEEFEEQSTRVIDPQVAYLTNDVLSDNEARTPEFGADSPMFFRGYDVAAKTGTTNDYRDVWIVGYSTSIAGGAWAGNNNNSPMQKKIAAFIIAPLWHEFMAYAFEKYPPESFTSPAPEANPDALPPVLANNWNTDPSQGVHEILHWVNKDNPRGPRPLNPTSDNQYAYWDFPVQLWVNGTIASSTGDVYTNPSGLQFTSPLPNAMYPSMTPITFTVSVQDPQNVRRILYYLNGAQIGLSLTPPYSVMFAPIGRGLFTARAVVERIDSTLEEKTTSFTLY